MSNSTIDDLDRLEAMITKVLMIASDSSPSARGTEADSDAANSPAPLARIRALNEPDDESADDMDDVPLATRLPASRKRSRSRTRSKSRTASRTRSRSRTPARSRSRTRTPSRARSVEDVEDVPLATRLLHRGVDKSTAKSMWLVGRARDVEYLVSQVIVSRVRRFVALAVRQIRPKGGDNAVTLGDEAIRALLTLSVDHMYHMLRSFALLYVSMRYVDPRKHPSIIIQGSFLPDFLQTLDGAYHDSRARTICPLVGVPANRSLTRGARGIMTNKKSSSRSLALKGATGRATSTKADRSCVFVSERMHLLSRRFFDALNELLAREIYRKGKGLEINVRISKEFGSEVNQAIVYVLYKGTRASIEIAERRARGSNFRVTDRDVQQAYKLMLPSNVPCPT